MLFNHKETHLYQDQSKLLFQYNNKNRIIFVSTFLVLGLGIAWAIPEYAKRTSGISDHQDKITATDKSDKPTLNSEGCK